MNTRSTITLTLSLGVALTSVMRGGDLKNHVLLISIDGMHAVDYEICAKALTCPNLAALGHTGINYTRTTTSRPSDSFPGLMALVTGGTPKSVGAFYDVAWDRVLAPPQNTTGNGLAGGTCTAGKNNGTQTEYEEGVEINQLLLNGGGPYKSVIDGGVLSIDPTRLERDPFSKPTSCAPCIPGTSSAPIRFSEWFTGLAALPLGRTSMPFMPLFRARRTPIRQVMSTTIIRPK